LKKDWISLVSKQLRIKLKTERIVVYYFWRFYCL